MMIFEFKLTEQEAQIVLDSLVKQPYVYVVQIINNIQQQAGEQMKKNGGN